MFTRTQAALAVPLLLLASCASPRFQGGAERTDCTTHTSLGPIAGAAQAGLCAFRGIPYAAAPVGMRRFRPPQPAPPWAGTLKATDAGRVCPQQRDELTEEYPDGRKVFADEDCLHLNVWTPGPDQRKRPVIVFIHGGAARFGTANEARYDGARLAARGDAVVIAINYRLGVLGWTELGGLDASYRGSGNNGLRDQIAALNWVREHVADFGGDPANVTAVGESEGAFCLSAMLATDHPERLFRRVVLQSGSGYLVHSAAQARTLAGRFPVRSVTALKAMPVTRLLELQNKVVEKDAPGVLGALYFGPYIDGTLVRDSVIERIARGNAREVDVLIGTNRDEVNFFGQFAPDGARMVAEQYASGLFPQRLATHRTHMVATYRKGRSAQDATLAMFTDQSLRVPAARLAEAQARWRPTYVYEFGWRPPNGAGAVHTIELPFVFGTLSFTGIPGGARALRTDLARLTKLSEQMMDAWASFARTGDPATRRTVPRPVWPAYTAPRRATMIWDLPASVANDPRGGERALWDRLAFDAFILQPQ